MDVVAAVICVSSARLCVGFAQAADLKQEGVCGGICTERVVFRQSTPASPATPLKGIGLQLIKQAMRGHMRVQRHLAILAQQ